MKISQRIANTLSLSAVSTCLATSAASHDGARKLQTMTVYAGYITGGAQTSEAITGDSKIYIDASMTQEAGSFALSKSFDTSSAPLPITILLGPHAPLSPLAFFFVF